jgi:hypothetical protein
MALALVAGPACSMKKMTTNVIGEISTKGIMAVEGESDVDFARESLPPLIKTLEVLRYGNTKDRRLLALLAKAYGSYTFGFVEQEILSAPEGSAEHKKALERAKLFYARGRDYGVQALSTNGAMKRAFDAHFRDFQRAVAGLGDKYIEALFWTAFNWANWINLNRDDPAAIVAMPKIQAMIDRVIALDSDFYYGSAHAFKGVLACSRPAMLGGDLALAQQEFAAAESSNPDYLMTKVLYAQYFARQQNDPALFREKLGAVLAADPAALAEQELSNKLAQRRASILMKMQKKLF